MNSFPWCTYGSQNIVCAAEVEMWHTKRVLVKYKQIFCSVLGEMQREASELVNILNVLLLHARIFASVFVCVFACLNMWVSMNVRYMSMYLFSYVCVRMNIPIRMYVDMYVYSYVNTYIHVFVPVCTYILHKCASLHLYPHASYWYIVTAIYSYIGKCLYVLWDKATAND